ncbi:hypothetical protein C8N35_101715 [Breoghania corrubedonensis]|uniref:Uncharacterized protein n=1 Tax=Breoghania corrubedonensis TaxID=665038 RepID=A0A2T5VG11_9HYPH|nr:hypothetical protein [Breoghania corrubedonensis]PTW62668.1 hypothetical protein C8N35_101715 [Breoghania corrubedonensis]
MKGKDNAPVPRGNVAKQAPAKPGLRSRGFLSHGGAPADDAADTQSRARATRSHDAVGDAVPRALDEEKPRKPFRMGGK